MRPEFEEKQYEGYFNVELDRRSSFFFPLGQAEEGILGFDAGAFSNSRSLFWGLGYPFFFRNIYRGATVRELAEEMNSDIEDFLNECDKIRVNLLFQYKRSDYLIESNAREWNSWNCPYYRYSISARQQNLLMRLHQRFNNEVLILYAAPAFHTYAELLSNYQSRSIISNSNFREAFELDNHRRNTFTSSGNYSIAFSNPERFENFDLFQRIQEFQPSEQRSNKEIINEFVQTVEDVMNHDEQYGPIFKELNSALEGMSQRLLRNFFVMINFKFLTDVQWVVAF